MFMHPKIQATSYYFHTPQLVAGTTRMISALFRSISMCSRQERCHEFELSSNLGYTSHTAATTSLSVPMGIHRIIQDLSRQFRDFLTKTA